MHENSKLMFARYVRPLISRTTRVLEIGPDFNPGFRSSYHGEMDHEVDAWDTLDVYESPRLTYVSKDPYRFPLADGSYDVVLSGSVIEHVPKPWVWVRELARVCRPGGRVVILAPVSWPYHEAPVDCWRIYPEGMKALLEDTGLELERCLWESLEYPGFRRYIPGRSLRSLGKWPKRFFRTLGRLGFPLERAYDIVAVARKA